MKLHKICYRQHLFWYHLPFLVMEISPWKQQTYWQVQWHNCNIFGRIFCCCHFSFFFFNLINSSKTDCKWLQSNVVSGKHFLPNVCQILIKFIQNWLLQRNSLPRIANFIILYGTTHDPCSWGPGLPLTRQQIVVSCWSQIQGRTQHIQLYLKLLVPFKP